MLSAKGYIQVHTYTSNARIPLKDVAVAVTTTDGDAIALRLTNRSGMLDELVEINVPDLAAGQSPNTGIIPFATVNLYANTADYEQIVIENLQIFPDVITDQNLEMIPLAELPDTWNRGEIFITTPQSL